MWAKWKCKDLYSWDYVSKLCEKIIWLVISYISSTEESTASLDLTSSTSDTPPTPGVVGTKQHPLAQPLNKSVNSAFDKYEKPPKSPQLKAPTKASSHHPPPLLTQQSLPASLPPAAHSSPRASPQPGLLSSLSQSGARLSPSLSGSNSSRKPGLRVSVYLDRTLKK